MAVGVLLNKKTRTAGQPTHEEWKSNDSGAALVSTVEGSTTALTTMQEAAAATGNGTALTVTGHSAVALEVTGTGSWTVTFEATTNGTDWRAIRGYTQTTGFAANATAAAGTFVFNVAGRQQIRARVSAWVSGSVTVTGRAVGAAFLWDIIASVTGTVTASNTTGNVAHGAADSGNPVKTGGKATAAAPAAVDEGDRVDASFTLTGSQRVAVTDSIPAGTNNIGDVDILSIAAGDNNIGNVDVLTIAAGDNNIGNVDIASAIPAGANIIGQVGIDQTTPGTTNLVQVGGTLPAFAATPTVDTELPAAAALADAAANPTTPTVGAALKVWNGTTWDNADGVNTGQLVVTPRGPTGIDVIGAPGAADPTGAVLMGGSDGANLRALSTLVSAGSADAKGGTLTGLATFNYLMGCNGTTWDRLRSVNTGQLVTTPKGSAGSEVIGATGAAVPAGAIMVGGAEASTLRALGMTAFSDGLNPATYYSASVAGHMFATNGTTSDRWRNNTAQTALASAQRTATTNSSDLTLYNEPGADFIINISSINAGTPSITINVQVKDNISGNYVTVLTSAALNSVATTRLRVYPGIAASANVAASDILRRTIRVSVTHADAQAIDYSISMGPIAA